MEKIKNSPHENLMIKIPIRITYDVLQDFLRKKIVGENIRIKEENGKVSNYAEVLDISIRKSIEEDYDLVFEVKFRTLTSFFRNKKGTAIIHAALGFDDKEQEIAVIDYDLEVKTSSWLMNKTLRAVANSNFLSDKLKKKLKYEFKPMVEKQLKTANVKLHEELEASEGIFVSGKLNNFRILDVIPGRERLVVLVSLEGNTVVDIKEIKLGKD